MKRLQLLVSAIAVGLAGVLCFANAAGAAENGPVVFAAASLKDALDAVDAEWQKKSDEAAIASYAGSSALAKQIEQGAPADIFISADTDWMDYLADRKLIKPETRVDLLGNRLVLIAPKNSTLSVDIKPGFPLASLLGDGRLAMADVSSVPAGRYGKASLQSLGVWDSVSNKIAQAENVRAALLLVSRGEAPLGIVYETDAEIDPGVKILGVFPESSHAPIVYPAAVLANAKSPDAAALMDYLRSAPAAAIFEHYGFSVLH